MSEQCIILIVDDQPANLDLLRETLDPEGYQIASAPNGEVALRIAARAKPSLILLDIIMPGLDGFDVCRQLKSNDATQEIPVLFVTAKDDTESIVEGFRLGGVDYITKPFEKAEVLARVETHLKICRLTQALLEEKTNLERANAQLRREIAKREQAEEAFQEADEELTTISEEEAERWGIAGFVGRSGIITEVLEQVRQLQTVGTTSVLISGESGTGKELIARAIHFGGTRANARFVPVNCSAIPSELFESMLFGHVRGAFTGANTSRKGYFERANSGTLFLDEIGDMPLELQAKLLRVLEDGTFTPIGADDEKHADVRILAATNANLHAKINDGTFRGDLYFRLARFTVEVPSLRERKEDIPLLASHFLEMFAKEMSRENVGLSQAALEALETYHFPGNIRELKNIIEHALILSRGATIQPEHLRFIEATGPTDASPQPAQAPTEPTPPSEAELPPYLSPDETRILTYVQQNGSINNAECRELLNVNKNQATYQLDKMQQAGLLVRRGLARSARYYLP